MANYTKATNINAKKFVVPSSRYMNSNVIYYTENNILTFTIYKKTTIPTSQKDVYAIVSPGSEYRPDIVSQKAYGTPDFWWKIMEANGISDIFDFKSGINIRIPNSILG